ncbi:MAG: hypothetical protein R3F65_10020 [bacterium]
MSEAGEGNRRREGAVVADGVVAEVEGGEAGEDGASAGAVVADAIAAEVEGGEAGEQASAGTVVADAVVAEIEGGEAVRGRARGRRRRRCRCRWLERGEAGEGGERAGAVVAVPWCRVKW